MKSKNAKKGSKNDKVKRNVQTMKKAPGGIQGKKSSVKKNWITE